MSNQHSCDHNEMRFDASQLAMGVYICKACDLTISANALYLASASTNLSVEDIARARNVDLKHIYDPGTVVVVRGQGQRLTVQSSPYANLEPWMIERATTPTPAMVSVAWFHDGELRTALFAPSVLEAVVG